MCCIFYICNVIFHTTKLTRSMKKVLFLLLFSAFVLPSLADDYPYLNFTKSDGTETSISVTNLTMTVSDGNLLLTNDSGSQTFALADLTKMYFSATSTGITDVNADDATAGEVKAFTLSGVFMGSYDSAAEAKAQLKPGVYLLKSESKTTKTVVQ